MDKDALRRRMREMKQALSVGEMEARGAKLGEMLRMQPVYRNAKTLYGFLPINQEIRTVPILRQAQAEGKRIAVPKVIGDEVKFYYLDDFTQVKVGCFGVSEPIDRLIPAEDEGALVLVPGLAFDRRGYRVGYGKGFYDRFLSRENAHPTVGLCYDFQLVDRIDKDEFDVPVELVLWA